ncbi:DUF6292 family protein [Thermomonospora umbrina]|uniref:DUF6292 domain-containing protein n=1 Tax=Thermomonospora umbrina TaxID=111806 RepID=A0A3D9T6R7_9ACTN|nr:DUF6292 family protein [Thermomonospora umbrina]REF00375.1 hypothetical protein DFJ69_5907 [Thermomonospora umbrina]
MDITEAMVRSYAAAVTTALREAGHQADDPFIDDQSALISIPDAFTDEGGRGGLALMWQPTHGWDAGVVTHGALNTRRITMHTDLRLGVVPEPKVVLRAMTTILEDGFLRAGRIMPDAPSVAEELAAYMNGG